MKKLTIVVDATSIVNTGGLTHLHEILYHYEEKAHPAIKTIIIIGSTKVLNSLPKKDIFKNKTSFLLNSNKFFRLIYQIFLMDFFLKKNADILFSLSGDFIGRFNPVVGMSQNMLLYERKFWSEIKSFKEKTKLFINFKRQQKCFKKSSGIIFISNYAKKYISNVLSLTEKKASVIHHGISERFVFKNNLKKSLKNYSFEDPFKFIYVSTIHVYKNQWNVIEAIANLRDIGYPVSLTLIGSIIYKPSGKRMISIMKDRDPKNEFINYIEEVEYNKIQNFYSSHDGIIFASSCENMPNILIESMGSGLPVACSEKMPMPEFLGDGGIYFNPTLVESIEQSLINLLSNLPLLEQRTNNLKKLKNFSWRDTSKKTFSFISNINA